MPEYVQKNFSQYLKYYAFKKRILTEEEKFDAEVYYTGGSAALTRLILNIQFGIPLIKHYPGKYWFPKNTTKWIV